MPASYARRAQEVAALVLAVVCAGKAVAALIAHKALAVHRGLGVALCLDQAELAAAHLAAHNALEVLLLLLGRLCGLVHGLCARVRRCDVARQALLLAAQRLVASSHLRGLHVVLFDHTALVAAWLETTDAAGLCGVCVEVPCQTLFFACCLICHCLLVELCEVACLLG